MTSTAYILLSFVAILVLGLAQVVMKYLSYNKRISFTQSYGNTYGEFASARHSGVFDAESYQWLTYNVNKMQRELGGDGIIRTYKPAYENYFINHYQILVNSLPRIRSG